jgi:hypothetical protein
MRRAERKALALTRARMAEVGEAPDEMTNRELRDAIRGCVRQAQRRGPGGPEPPTPTWWQWSAYAPGSSRDEAIGRVTDALADERFVASDATLWTAGPLHVASASD